MVGTGLIILSDLLCGLMRMNFSEKIHLIHLFTEYDTGSQRENLFRHHAKDPLTR